MSKKSTPPAEGWYADTSQPGAERYWDGAGWTDLTRPLGPPPPAAKQKTFGRSEADKAKDRNFVKVAGLGFFAIVMISVVVSAASDPATVPRTEAASGTEPAHSAAEADAEIPEQLALADTTTTITPPTPLEAFEAQVADETDRLDEVFYDEELEFLRVEIYMDLLGFWVDTEVNGQIKNILELVATSELEVQNFDLAIHMEFVDQLGNSEEGVALRASWTGDTIRNINFPNFLRDNVLPIGEVTYIHPAIASELDG
jgi:hypothetical protein